MVQTLAHATSGLSVRAYDNRRRALALTMVLAFPFFLAGAVLRRINPFGPRPARAPIFAETRARAAAVIPFIFMG